MAYELRKIENSGVSCPFCGGRVVKTTKSSQGKLRYRCVTEKITFTEKTVYNIVGKIIEVD